MKLNIRHFKAKITTTKIKIPNFKTLKFNLPQFTMPKIKRPAFAWPFAAIKIQKFKASHIKLPNIRPPQIKLPQFQAPKIIAPKFSKLRLPDLKPRMSYQNAKNILTMSCFCALMVVLMFMINTFNMWPSVADASQLSFIKTNKSFIAENNLPQIQLSELNNIAPAAGYDGVGSTNITEPDDESLNDGYKYKIEENILNVEAVLVPHATTVISSSRDSKIKSINFDNGQSFKKDDILVEYTCDDARAEVEIAKTQKQLAEEKKVASYKLFKLDIISNIERLELETETKQAQARAALHTSRLQDCFIRAEYDGRVVKRLANAGEFTRTDRVLMEVASLDTLKAEFLLPSRWLRWINIGAPVTINIDETGEAYPAKISNIYGEVDPISQSIQITTQLEDYTDKLLPGMSGKAELDINAIRKAGIIGFLETRIQD